MTAPLDIPPRRDIEKALRDAGLSHRVARKMVAISWPQIVGEAKAEHDDMCAKFEDLKTLFDTAHGDDTA